MTLLGFHVQFNSEIAISAPGDMKRSECVGVQVHLNIREHRGNHSTARLLFCSEICHASKPNAQRKKLPSRSGQRKTVQWERGAGLQNAGVAQQVSASKSLQFQ